MQYYPLRPFLKIHFFNKGGGGGGSACGNLARKLVSLIYIAKKISNFMSDNFSTKNAVLALRVSGEEDSYGTREIFKERMGRCHELQIHDNGLSSQNEK